MGEIPPEYISDDVPETGGSRFEVFYPEAYALNKQAILENVEDGSNVLDLGCGDGYAEKTICREKKDCFIIAVDKDEKSTMRIVNYTDGLKPYHDKKAGASPNEIEIHQQDANSFLRVCEPGHQDVIISQASLHEIGDPLDQEEYLDWFFSQAKRVLRPGGKVVVGDYYYSPEVSDDDVRRFMDYQMDQIGHADTRDMFVSPDLLLKKAQEHGFGLVSQKEIRAVKQIDRRYYSIVFEGGK